MSESYIYKSTGGYNSKLFINEIEDVLECSICTDIAREPISLSCKCGRIYCKSCLNLMKSSICPICRIEYNSITLQINTFAQKQINQLKMKCLHYELGCDAQYEIGMDDHNIIEHRNVCKYENEKCIKCNDMIIRKDMNNHKKNKCKNRSVECKVCHTWY